MNPMSENTIKKALRKMAVTPEATSIVMVFVL